MDMNVDPDLALRHSSRLVELANELVEAAGRVRATDVGQPPTGYTEGMPPGIDAVARRAAVAGGLAEHAVRLAAIAADLRRYARSAGEHDAAVADGARRMASRLPSVIHLAPSGGRAMGAGTAGAPDWAGGWSR